MGARSIVGLVCLVLGGVWIAQGFDLLKGSPMTGVSFWAWVGIAVVAAGLGLVGWDLVARRRSK